MTESSVGNIIVRPARADDFDFVSDLMVRALTPFYDGDHRAHARRIFETHMNGGIDHVGHFSAGQHMFIAESDDGQPVGVIHVVNKKQGTVKISPLIVDTTYRGKMGIGSMLLKHAEDFARSHGARQIYCTVAVPNQKALRFFLGKGFRVTGTAKDHYKIGVDEHMLYKQLVDEAGFDSPNISVVSFDESQHADSARALILSQMSDAFNGVDNDWVDALFAGYRRRELCDVNTKFKVIFVAECDGEVVGVTNVGKSTLINAIIQEITGDKDIITTSRFPGTTLDKIEIPLADGSHIYDTPGIIHRHQMAHYLSAKNLKYVSPKKEIKPKTYQLNPEQTLFLGGLGRFDFVAGDKQGFTAYFDNELKLHRTKLEGASDFYDKHVGSLLVPPVGKEKEEFPALVKHEFTIKDKTDIVFSGLGWIRVNDRAKVAAWAPKGVDVVLRKAII